MANILSEAKTISQVECLLQTLFGVIAGYNEMPLLAVMAYDRYIAICNPLRYSSLMTKMRMCILLIVPWLYSFCIAVPFLFQALSLPLCGKFIVGICCDFQAYIKLSCTNVSVNNIYETCISVIHTAMLIVVIVYSYVQIFKVCYRTSSGTKSKALNTCMTHLLLLFTYLLGGLLVFFQLRMGNVSALDFVQLFMSLLFFMIPSLFNPLIYGIRTQDIRKAIQKVITNSMLCSIVNI
ncbi:olfactory receptor 2K2-like [Protopterus annectens]|uniref:olfactory receptor 2K2-like n=1 Tax=Protopterus annectens TaxID=7888 RepID=UPI001CFAC2F4|nr:olfactory receptor 2K2-like [Protopterus annectens]